MNYRKLVGEKVYLSPVSTRDWQLYDKWAADYETAFLSRGGDDFVRPPAVDSSSLENRAKNKNTFSIVDKATDNTIGHCGFNFEDIANRYAKIGIIIGEKDYWSNGYGTDAMRLMLDFGFNVRGYNNISLNVYEYNERAIACYEKLGFKLQGTWRERLICGQKRYNCLHFDMLASEYFG
ncbi:MAG: GNAT family N-acetyltransferase [Defluviitaleaceae bacterium]|nr:GNAT family N-acetyltransferase [Defluviitaleaceae bacterium]